MTRNRPIVAIDGPAGAGKSTIARRLADALGFLLVDTGAMYRAVALASLRDHIREDDGEALGAMASKLVIDRALSLASDPARGTTVILRGEDVSDAIRTPEVAMAASRTSAHPSVRAALLDLQRHAGAAGGVVLEGRDIGTVVFPDAEIKFFLTASPEMRAKRRYDELRARGEVVSLDATLLEVVRRDAQDTERVIAPLKMAADALAIDTTALTVDVVIQTMLGHVRAVFPARR